MEGSSWDVCFNQCLEVDRSDSIDRLVCQYHHLESNASDYREPVEVPEEGGHARHLKRLEIKMVGNKVKLNK